MWPHNYVIGRNEYLISTSSKTTFPWVYSLQFLFKSTHNSWRYERNVSGCFFPEHSVLLYIELYAIVHMHTYLGSTLLTMCNGQVEDINYLKNNWFLCNFICLITLSRYSVYTFRKSCCLGLRIGPRRDIECCAITSLSLFFFFFFAFLYVHY